MKPHYTALAINQACSVLLTEMKRSVVVFKCRKPGLMTLSMNRYARELSEKIQHYLIDYVPTMLASLGWPHTYNGSVWRS